MTDKESQSAHIMHDTVVFFGSGPVAAKALQLLVKDFSIEAVITKPKPAHHKGDFPVLETAKALRLKTFTPTNKAELSALFTQQPVRSHLGIVIDYGIIISQDVIDYFPLGIVNSHFSLLPQWRGADPITFALLSGQERTGVSLMLITKGLDEGPLLAQAEWEVKPEVTAPELTEELIKLSHTMLCAILPLYAKGELRPTDQVEGTIADSAEPTYSRKLTKEDGILDFTKPADQLEREIRAFIEWPRSRTKLFNKDVVITKAHAVPFSDPEAKPGDVETSKQGVIMIHCAGGYLCIDNLIPAGKKEMSAQAFLAGYKTE